MHLTKRNTNKHQTLIHHVTIYMDISSHHPAIPSPPQKQQTTENPSRPTGPASPPVDRKPPPVPLGQKPTPISMETLQETRPHHSPKTLLHLRHRRLFTQTSQTSAENPRSIILQQAHFYRDAEALLQQHGLGVLPLWRLLERVEEDGIASSPQRWQDPILRPIREEEVSFMIAKIGKICDDGREAGIVDLSEMAHSLSSTLICRIALGSGREDEESKKERRFGEMLREAQGVLACLCVADFFPSLSWVDRLNGYRDWIDTTYEKSDALYQDIIDKHLDPKRKRKKENENMDVDENEDEDEDEEDFVDILIKLKEEESLYHDFNIS